MNENQTKETSLVDTTDCLEAVGVFRGWKNFLFVITILCLLLLQASFWAAQTGYIKPACDAPAAGPEDTEQIKDAAEKVAADPNQPVEAAPKHSICSFFKINFDCLIWLVRFVDYLLILTAILYCLTLLFILKVSMVGRLGGINHIARAFFLSLAFVVLLLPWQKFFGCVVAGAMFTPSELQSACTKLEAEGCSLFATILHYLRFTGYWLLVLLLLIFSHIRSCRWAKAILRRLEVI